MISFDRPVTWTRWQPNRHDPWTSGPLIYLMTDVPLDACAVTPGATPHPPDANGIACPPLTSLSSGGVLATWSTTRILQPLRTIGESIKINGEEAHLDIERPGGCTDIGGDETLTASIPLGPNMSRYTNIVFDACLRGPDLIVNEGLVRKMLTSVVFGP